MKKKIKECFFFVYSSWNGKNGTTSSVLRGRLADGRVTDVVVQLVREGLVDHRQGLAGVPEAVVPPPHLPSAAKHALELLGLAPVQRLDLAVQLGLVLAQVHPDRGLDVRQKGLGLGLVPPRDGVHQRVVRLRLAVQEDLALQHRPCDLEGVPRERHRVQRGHRVPGLHLAHLEALDPHRAARQQLDVPGDRAVRQEGHLPRGGERGRERLGHRAPGEGGVLPSLLRGGW
mmetsp:Transcript_5076/g.18332  ORF Transcript_5076/g.18332 Transcript_5076/m.18332 type:complete len:230 (+) Transcript_5076:802-1491(+)